MEEKNQNIQMLSLMRQPAILVQQGLITYANPAAGAYLLRPGMEFSSLLATGKSEYLSFAEGCMHATVCLEGNTLDATVLRDLHREIVILEDRADNATLRALSLAALELRMPLSGAAAITERMLPLAGQDGPLQAHTAQLNRRMLQLQRIIANMADCEHYFRRDEKAMEYVEFRGFLQELLAKAAEALAAADRHLEWELPQQPIYLWAEAQKLERMVYNLLSNAAKFSPAGSCIRVQLRQNGDRLALSVMDQGDGIANMGDIFTKYLRQPGLEDPRLGLGLGMVLVRATAIVHGGAVLLDHPEGWSTRVTVTLAMERKRDALVRCPAFRIDYAGERDHCLLELSDVLPEQLYGTEKK